MFNNNKTQDFILGAVIGGTVGALTTMLFTTKKGKELRKNIADKYHELEENLKETADDLQDSAKSQVNKVASKFKKDDSKD
jgi:gas vesicle protein